MFSHAACCAGVEKLRASVMVVTVPVDELALTGALTPSTVVPTVKREATTADPLRCLTCLIPRLLKSRYFMEALQTARRPSACFHELSCVKH
jgi:hypothetical protein